MRVESGIEKSDRYSASGERFMRIQAQRRRQDVVVLIKYRNMRFDLGFRPFQKLETLGANRGWFFPRSVRIHQCLQFGAGRRCKILRTAQAAAEVTRAREIFFINNPGWS